MVWRAAVLGEARILLRGASAGVRRGGSFFASSGAPWLAGLRGRARSLPLASVPLDWDGDHFYSLFASRFGESAADARACPQIS